MLFRSRYNNDIEVPNFSYPGLDVFPNVLKNDFSLGDVEWVFFASSGFFSLLSIFFGHLVPSFAYTMLANQFLDLTPGALVWSLRLQYLLLMLAGSFFLVAALSAAARARKVRDEGVTAGVVT